MPVQLQGATPINIVACKLIAGAPMPISQPYDVPFVGAAVAAAPRTLTAKPYSDLPPFPLSHPRILYNSVLPGASVTGAPVQVLTPRTSDRWAFTGTATATITLSANQSVDTVALGACQTTGKTVLIEYSATIDGAFVSFAASQVNAESAMMFFREPVSLRRIRITVTGAGVSAIGVIYAGLALQMQRPIYGGVNPITLNRVTDYFNNKSESGEWLGRQIRRRGLESSLSFERLTAPWYRQYFDPFVRAARETPFFFAWRPSDYPAECAYCWTDSDIQPSNSGGGTNHMSVSVSVKAHS